MKQLYVVLDRDNERNLIVLPTKRTFTLEAAEKAGIHVHWEFEHGDYHIRIYGAMPAHKEGESREEIERMALETLNLI